MCVKCYIHKMDALATIHYYALEWTASEFPWKSPTLLPLPSLCMTITCHIMQIVCGGKL